jgi:hypothetical protein
MMAIMDQPAMDPLEELFKPAEDGTAKSLTCRSV